MDDGAQQTARSRVEKAVLYMETLRARMEPEAFQALAEAVQGTVVCLAQGRDGVFGSEDNPAFTKDVQREYATVAAILGTGRLDHRWVEVPCADGQPGYALVDAETAADPAKLEQVRAGMARWLEARDATDAELGGIARASGIDPD
ncbi:hypothetical protein [Streptomyces sp. WMMB303]|uniref:hypothetical protein n=1 Tax=Streptomyces sp. WMMB303 TaxID=3034154 RepID=UPI0023ECE6E7|nr:hypothetical protein [Streptomyces sp. WMMB303]MDF4248780.1 hypothetical protein [Streptomyces sp. WMMB303]